MSGYLGTEIKRNTANIAARFREIPICAYRLTISEEKRIYTNRDFLKIYRDMLVIREFETMLSALKTNGSYHGVSYPLKKSVVLDFGREAISVGEAYCSGSSDDMFSSDRNIGDLIAKGLAAIEKMTDDELAQIMRGYHEGAVLSPLADVTDKRASVKDVALDFLLYGLLSEIFNKTTGFCYGSCGSRNVYFTPFGFYPCNMTESDAAGLAIGAALYHRNCGSNGTVIANMNAEAVGDGKVWEAFCLAGAGALRTKKSAELPILFVLNRSRDADETEMSVHRCAARICAGIGTDMMYAETVNGSDPLAVIDAISRKKEILKRGESAALLEMVFSDLQEIPSGADPVKLYREKLIRGGIIGAAELKALEEHIAERITKICKLAADGEKSPAADTFCEESASFANTDGKKRPVRRIMPEVKIPKNACKRLQEIQKKRGGSSEYQIGDAVFESVLDRMYCDPDFAVFAMKGKESSLAGLAEAVDSHRFLSIPASGATLVSCALGYVLRGGSALVSLDSDQTAIAVSDVLIRQISAWSLRGAGKLSLPLVVCVPCENQNGFSAAEAFLSAVSAVPAVKSVYPATPDDAKEIMTAALDEENPVIFMESKICCHIEKDFEENDASQTANVLSIGKPSLKKEGKDITVLTVGASLCYTMKAAAQLSEIYGVEAEIFSARTIVPFNGDSVLRSVEKTGKLLILGEGLLMYSLAAELGELAFDFLDAPVIVAGVKDEAEIIRLIHSKIIPLDGM